MIKHSIYPDVVIPTVPFSTYVLNRVKTYGDAVALVDNTREKSVTFAQVYDQSIRCAAAFRAFGIKKGDVIAIASSNRVEYGIVLLAAVACGAAASPCNPLYQEEEFLQLLSISEPCIIFGELENVEKLKNLSQKLSCIKKIICFEEKAGYTTYSDLISNENTEDQPVDIDVMEDIAFLPYSSGTTGLPKAVMLTHHSLNSLVTVFSAQVNMFRSNCFYMVVPMFHVLGFGLTMNCLSVGVKTVFDPRFGLEKMLMAFEKHKVSHFTAVPPIMIAMTMTSLFEKYDLSSLKCVLCGAAPLAPKLVEDMIQKYKVIVTQAYGLTECVPLSVADPVTYSYTTAGAITPNTLIKILDVETGKELGPEEDGEIIAKGPQIMKGYYKNPKATAETIDKDGWLHTGDIGHYDEDGMLYVVDRLKELIKCKGFQVAPAELEALLLKHPKVADAAVIGIPNEESGEVPKAFVVKKDPAVTVEELKEFVAGHVSKFKHLEGGVEFVEKIPKSLSGKILRKDLRKQEFGK